MNQELEGPSPKSTQMNLGATTRHPPAHSQIKLTQATRMRIPSLGTFPQRFDASHYIIIAHALPTHSVLLDRILLSRKILA